MCVPVYSGLPGGQGRLTSSLQSKQLSCYSSAAPPPRPPDVQLCAESHVCPSLHCTLVEKGDVAEQPGSGIRWDAGVFAVPARHPGPVVCPGSCPAARPPPSATESSSPETPWSSLARAASLVAVAVAVSSQGEHKPRGFPGEPSAPSQECVARETCRHTAVAVGMALSRPLFITAFGEIHELFSYGFFSSA